MVNHGEQQSLNWELAKTKVHDWGIQTHIWQDIFIDAATQDKFQEWNFKRKLWAYDQISKSNMHGMLTSCFCHFRPYRLLAQPVFIIIYIYLLFNLSYP